MSAQAGGQAEERLAGRIRTEREPDWELDPTTQAETTSPTLYQLGHPGPPRARSHTAFRLILTIALRRMWNTHIIVLHHTMPFHLTEAVGHVMHKKYSDSLKRTLSQEG